MIEATEKAGAGEKGCSTQYSPSTPLVLLYFIGKMLGESIPPLKYVVFLRFGATPVSAPAENPRFSGRLGGSFAKKSIRTE